MPRVPGLLGAGVARGMTKDVCGRCGRPSIAHARGPNPCAALRNAEREAARLAKMEARKGRRCATCGGEIPLFRGDNARYCWDGCYRGRRRPAKYECGSCAWTGNIQGDYIAHLATHGERCAFSPSHVERADIDRMRSLYLEAFAGIPKTMSKKEAMKKLWARGDGFRCGRCGEGTSSPVAARFHCRGTPASAGPPR